LPLWIGENHIRNGELPRRRLVWVGAIVEDAEALAKYERLIPGTNGFNEFVQQAVA
jgi:hypothetical protein